MSIKRSYISSPALTFAILCIGLGCIVAATLKQNLAIAGLVAALPALLCILILHLRKPERFLFLLFIFNYFFPPLVGHHLVERASHRHRPDCATLPFSLETGRQHSHHRGCRTGGVLPYGSR